MALAPNATAKMNGVTVNEKIIPDGTKWKDATKAKAAGCSVGTRYKREEKLSGNTGKVQFVTVHNTNDLANVNDDAEQYTRATYNENMGLSRVHYYIDDVGAWQNLKAGTGLFAADPIGSAEVSWHAGDGSVSNSGNMTSLSLEIIMNDTTAHDKKAYDNGARIAAWLLWKHKLTIDKLVTHTYWVNKSAGKSFADVDEQCTNRISGKKWCPTYIFGSTNQEKALANWKAFKSLVKKYLDELNGEKVEAKPEAKPESKYTQKQFVKDVQKAIGAAVDGVPGNETISKTVTLSATKNRTHAAVKPVQKQLAALGYTEVGKADGIAGAKFTVAVKRYQEEVVGMKKPDGEITAQNKTWRKLLKMK